MNSNKDNKELLKEKIDQNLAQYMSEWQNMTPERLIAIADEICAVKAMAELIPFYAKSEHAEYLLRFKNPLAVVSDAWKEQNDAISIGEISHTLWEITDKKDMEESYEMESDEDISMTMQ